MVRESEAGEGTPRRRLSMVGTVEDLVAGSLLAALAGELEAGHRKVLVEGLVEAGAASGLGAREPFGIGDEYVAAGLGDAAFVSDAAVDVGDGAEGARPSGGGGAREEIGFPPVVALVAGGFGGLAKRCGGSGGVVRGVYVWRRNPKVCDRNNVVHARSPPWLDRAAALAGEAR